MVHHVWNAQTLACTNNQPKLCTNNQPDFCTIKPLHSPKKFTMTQSNYSPLLNCKYCNFSCSFIYQINLTLLQQLLHMHTRKKWKETYIWYCIIYKVFICTFQSLYMLTVSSIFYKCSGGKQQLMFSFISSSSFSQQQLLYPSTLQTTTNYHRYHNIIIHNDDN